jgi:hypothetical protein
MSDLIQLTDAELDLVSGGDNVNLNRTTQGALAQAGGNFVQIGGRDTAVAVNLNATFQRNSSSGFNF